MKTLLDYQLNKLFFDLHSDKTLATAYRADRAPILARYKLKPQTLESLARDDVAAIYPTVNPFLLRYYFFLIGMSDHEVVERLAPWRDASMPLETGVG